MLPRIKKTDDGFSFDWEFSVPLVPLVVLIGLSVWGLVWLIN